MEQRTTTKPTEPLRRIGPCTSTPVGPVLGLFDPAIAFGGLLNSLQVFGASIIHPPEWILPLCLFWSLEEPGGNQAQSSNLSIHPGIPARDND
jgi:hypothetical protein